MFEHREMTDAEKTEVARASIVLKQMRGGNTAAMVEHRHDMMIHPETWWAYDMAEALGRSAASSSLVASGAGSGGSAPEADLTEYAHPSDYAHWSLREGWWKRRQHTAYWTGDLTDPMGG